MVSFSIMSMFSFVLTFHIDVSFCERDPKANHFRLMIDPRAGKFKENELSGFSAKVVPDNERSKMVPIYKGDDGKLMHVGGYDCYREYFCTFAPLPSGTFKERLAKLTKRPSLWEKTSELAPRTMHFRRQIAGAQPIDAQPVSTENARPDMAADVEAPLDLSGGQLTDTGVDEILADEDLPPPFEAGSKDDPDNFPGEKLDEKLYEEGEI